MRQQPRRWGVQVQGQRRDENHRDIANAESAYYDGETSDFDYHKAISELLKDPVSLGIIGVNSPRGYQR